MGPVNASALGGTSANTSESRNYAIAHRTQKPHASLFGKEHTAIPGKCRGGISHRTGSKASANPTATGEGRKWLHTHCEEHGRGGGEPGKSGVPGRIVHARHESGQFGEVSSLRDTHLSTLGT